MFIDARTLEPESTIEADICIVGAGAAGITLARELAGEHRKVAVLESGGFEFDEATQNLYAGDIVGQPFSPIDADRLRFFGGTTNHWEGGCRPFDPLDFEKRDYIPHSGWPFGAEEMAPYYRRAQEICQLGPFTYDPSAWTGGGPGPLEFGADARIHTLVFQNSPPTRFGTVYRDDLDKAQSVAVYLNANVTDIEITDNANEVTRLRVACLKGPGFWVKARRYVLAAGGIENPRLLLNADKVEKNGLGNQNDLVGRFFMDHPNLRKTANIVFTEDYPNFAFYDYHVVNGIKMFAGFTATEEAQRRERLPNFYILIERGHLADESTSVASLRSLYKSIRAGHWPDHIGFHLSRIVGDLDGLAGAVYRRVRGEEPPLFSTFYSCECPPDPESRVSLIPATDALGLRRVKLDWRLPGDFEETMHRAHRLLGEELGRAGLGRLRINTAETTHDPMTEIENGHHHMGTTRMHEDPKQGVVDANCRVHGKANLYIAGSSVFPTYSLDNPTMTLVALAVRLADHLKAQGVDG
jgi:choline dehydrogenase-like flavoprotein